MLQEFSGQDWGNPRDGEGLRVKGTATPEFRLRRFCHDRADN
ncbi:hypothetical protein N44_02535 [Microcystis aeruginosa NIES-44]|uniref:Uncharacterized protein n=1 Tax=Microcystis aeruginosa NIES-44 TaxID=449439 RepID=A0A0A1VW75_MICAE|nr:hypothetical protein N44_02535 [Microcystis aeruginosa NIES-44]